MLGATKTLLDQGLLAQDGIIGSPVFLNVWTVFWMVLLAATGTELSSMLTPTTGTEADT